MSRKFTVEDFVTKARNIHFKKVYDYSLVEYTNTSTKIKIKIKIKKDKENIVDKMLQEIKYTC
jgi:hypothetical protein